MKKMLIKKVEGIIAVTVGCRRKMMMFMTLEIMQLRGIVFMAVVTWTGRSLMMIKTRKRMRAVRHDKATMRRAINGVDD